MAYLGRHGNKGSHKSNPQCLALPAANLPYAVNDRPGGNHQQTKFDTGTKFHIMYRTYVLLRLTKRSHDRQNTRVRNHF
jgi:hypothetical protein